jgi:hypothetical protein
MRLDRTSWTELSTYRQCPHKHKLQYVDGWRPEQTSRPLTMGIAWHTIMEAHYQGLIVDDLAGSLEKIIKILEDWDARKPEGPNHEIGTTLAWMYDGYRKRWDVEDKQWEIIDVEGEIEFELPSGIMLYGRYDLVIRLGKRFIWVVDHKGNKTLPSQKELDLDDQTALYIEGVRRQLKLPVRGAIINSARTDKLKRPMELRERYGRYPIHRTDNEIAMIVKEADATAVKSKNDPERERHPDPQNCKWRCEYMEGCLGGRREPHLERQILLAKGFHKRAASPPLDTRASNVIEFPT